MSIEIKSRYGGRVLYTAENAADVREALVEATRKDADLRGAYLRDADLRDADLRGAYLGGAYLRDADLRDADLRGADLRDADLGDADLGDAFDRRHPLWPVRLDLWSVLDAAPAEVATLREKVVAGEVNGSVYEGECACLVGTIANARGTNYRELSDLKPDVDRPAEKWFLAVNKGDLPVLVAEGADVEGATKTARENRDAITEGAWRATWVLRWIDQWTESRTSTAAALLVVSPDLVLRNLSREQLETLAAASETHVDTIDAEERKS